MAGWVMGDASLMGSPVQTPEQFRAMAVSTYGDRSEEFLKLFPVGTEAEFKSSQEKLGILNFAAFPDYLWALSNKSNTFLYQFSYIPTDKPGFPNYGAFHTSDVPFALKTLKRWNRPWTKTDYDVEKVMSSFWINFVKTGNPNGKGLPEWKSYSESGSWVMELSTSPLMKSSLYQAEFRFLSDFLK
jgi:para-nitrobenzyl esterase